MRIKTRNIFIFFIQATGTEAMPTIKLTKFMEMSKFTQTKAEFNYIDFTNVIVIM